MQMLDRLKSRVKRRVLEPARRSLHATRFHFSGEAKFRERYFAEVPVDLDAMTEFRSELFPNAGPMAWLDRPDWEAEVARRQQRGLLSEAEAAVCRKWAVDGYFVLENPFRDGYLDEVWRAYERAVASGIITLEAEPGGPDDRHPGRYLNPHLKVPEMKAALYAPELLKWVRLLLGREPAPFQTIASHKGSQQLEHSDSIHMTTYPLGFMCAAWIAFEDIHPDSGPLLYYPGSHRWPYYFSRHVGIEPGEFRAKGYVTYAEKYEPFMQERVKELGARPRHFTAKKGDVLFWHSNLVHGGSRRNDLSHTRRAMVGHYFAVGAVCYHDLSGVIADDRHGSNR
jgi:hypothetical protein